ncbi:N-acetylglucosamine-6-phosphate deacetylase [Andreprevotia lacus DSM 23236]|jgi:N-acetylglucosamine-6-phosphate deacetylase|uniref:N-acetylglucosamine-6-phosphate deacetylase n=1 Tax=Andreprevotia lacus DSM 23236 TaxID=1121001 RepID=A0A1W1X3X5_9NEIS|nr:N-acetylglucosamine-6-phosphate deacetylase [Andreprevotia lacus]SMC18530.1 N-acetylglucosamine-6-phosphate deacetylase [Andreprevotia lacus DSM 23236]
MLNGNILTPDGWRHGSLAFDAGRIAQLGGHAVDPADNGDEYILPGFIDLHVHGGLGLDTMDGADATVRIARMHAQHGTTAMLATTVCTTHDKLRALLAELAAPITLRPANAPRLLGVHLEGPYVNPGRLGGLPNEVRPAVLAELDEYMALVPVKVVTLSPEIAGHDAIIRTLAERGVRVQIGHTLGTYEEGMQALQHGVAGFTHLYNAMTPLNHRAPGMVGAALAHAQYSELIPDLIHVHPGAMKVALRSIPKLYCVTDATQTAGLPDGTYTGRGRSVTKCLGAVTLPDGTLAGSALTMDLVLRNLVSLGLSVEDASNRISRNPADYLGLADRGRLALGAWGDAVVLDRELRVKAVYVEGTALDLHQPT